MAQDPWTAEDAYERFMGRWSRLLAAEHVQLLDAGPGLRWLDGGCGTGALSAAILAAEPASVCGVDSSEAFVDGARRQCGDGRATFQVADVTALPFSDGEFDVVASGLVLNFVPEPARALAEFIRVTRPGGSVSAYVWDYAEGMVMLRQFWDAAVALDPAAAGPDEGARFPLCHPQALANLWAGVGLDAVRTDALSITTAFRDFDDYWQPFLGGQGPAAAYVASLDGVQREALREDLRGRLPAGPDGSIVLPARAWAVRGRSSPATTR